jgi:hypothetical protein
MDDTTAAGPRCSHAKQHDKWQAFEASIMTNIIIITKEKEETGTGLFCCEKGMLGIIIIVW